MPAGHSGITLRSLALQAENQSFDPIGRQPPRTALEIGCETLLELELIRASASDDVSGRLRRAIASLRFVLNQLRLAQAPHAGALNYGFVMAEPTRKPQ